MVSYPEGTSYTVLSPIPVLPEGERGEKQLEVYLKMGFGRIDVDGKVIRINDLLSHDVDVSLGKAVGGCFLVVDRLGVDYGRDSISRLLDSVETAIYEGNGTCLLRFYLPDGTVKFHIFSNKF
jgi:excinuclease ABC subunit A